MKDNFSININNLTIGIFVEHKNKGEEYGHESSDAKERGVSSGYGDRSDKTRDINNESGDRNFESGKGNVESNIAEPLGTETKDVSTSACKPWFLSKTIASNSIAVIGLQIAFFINDNPDTFSAILPASILAVLNIFLRTLTKESLTYKTAKDGKNGKR
jgi:hypothetical protein